MDKLILYFLYADDNKYLQKKIICKRFKGQQFFFIITQHSRKLLNFKIKLYYLSLWLCFYKNYCKINDKIDENKNKKKVNVV